MIRVIDCRNRDRYANSLKQLFCLRHAVFVDELRWRASDQTNGETDEYDDEHTIYIASVDPKGDVLGCIRLYPTARAYMMQEHFNDMVHGAHIQKPDVLEASRFAIAKHKRHGAGVYLELFVGMVEYCLSANVVGTIALMRTLKIPQLLSAGMDVRPLGLSKDIGGEHNTAVYYAINHSVLSRMCQVAGVTGSVLEGTQPWPSVA